MSVFFFASLGLASGRVMGLGRGKMGLGRQERGWVSDSERWLRRLRVVEEVSIYSKRSRNDQKRYLIERRREIIRRSRRSPSTFGRRLFGMTECKPKKARANRTLRLGQVKDHGYERTRLIGS